eukprot:6246185-Pyramimonas_sp.AAC.1
MEAPTKTRAPWRQAGCIFGMGWHCRSERSGPQTRDPPGPEAVLVSASWLHLRDGKAPPTL